MGNYKFKLSDMIPNAWFYKLRDMSRSKKQTNSNKKPHLSHPRKSIYHSSEAIIRAQKFSNSPTNSKFSDTHFPSFAKKPSKIRSKRKTIYKPSPKLSTSPVSVWEKTEKICPQEYLFSSSESSDDEFYQSPVSKTQSNSMDGGDLFNELSSWSSSCNCRVTSSTTDIFIDVNEKSSLSKNFENITFSDIQLRPILTKPSKLRNEKPDFRKQSSKEHNTLSVKIVKESSTTPLKERKNYVGIRKSISNSTGVKLKSNSPKIVSKKVRPCARKSVSSSRKSYGMSQKRSFSKSFAIVKSSIDPHKDFRDSMVEMIVENSISASEDLEELLACYLSLNSDEYHSVIVKVFEEIWFEMASLKL